MKTHKSFQTRFLFTIIALFCVISLHGQTESKEVTVDEATLKSYVGRYDYTQGAVLIVTLEDKQLQAQMTGQPKFPISPSAKNEFYWTVVDARVKFITDEKGNVIKAIHYQNGSELEAMKLKDESPVKVNPVIFDKYVGKYDAGEGNLLDITKVGDQLFVQGGSLPAYQLLPASETEYFLREANARLTFKSAGEKADTVLINMAGNHITALRIK